MRCAGNRGNLGIFIDLHHDNTLTGSGTDTDGRRFNTDNHTIIKNQNNIIVQVNRLDRRYLTEFFGMLIQQSETAPALYTVIALR